LTESEGKENPTTQPPPPQAARGGGRWGQGGGHLLKAQGLALRYGSFNAIRQMAPRIVAAWRGENLHWR